MYVVVDEGGAGYHGSSGPSRTVPLRFVMVLASLIRGTGVRLPRPDKPSFRVGGWAGNYWSAFSFLKLSAVNLCVCMCVCARVCVCVRSRMYLLLLIICIIRVWAFCAN